MTDLKKLVLEVLGNEQYGRQILNNHKELFDTLQTDTYVPSTEPSETHVAKLLPPAEAIDTYNDIDEDEEITIEDISHETEEDDSLSLEKKEKEMIVKALRRNNNKRKYAAQALGISERTLYRKIKQYQIDEE
jgi:transcriptional regulator with PAS, ATPase and Fis domain